MQANRTHDKHVEQARSFSTGSSPVNGPLVDDTQDEIAKDALHEQDLRQELCHDRVVLLEKPEVWNLQADGKSHLQKRCQSWRIRLKPALKVTHVNDTNDDGHLHLE